ncbi:histone deacetylase [Roseateles sp.]|jgi:acetoin utilization deacetylase AcuC-like enzyme|uniref:histone deacetylase family protein n=1 Tax=Roseateles sp. TaxID=1971397 RepID=UPI0039190918
MQAFHADAYRLELPPGHRFPEAKYGLLRQRLEALGPPFRIAPAPLAEAQALLRVHSPHYVQAVFQGSLSAAQQREIGFPWSPSMALRSRCSVGATLEAARAALAEGVGANLAGGTHHAYADKGSGYCVFNDVAVAARQMQAMARREGRQELQVLVVDLDVHQGNGTAAIFREDPSVFTFSMHGARNFPFRKEASDLDVDLPDGCGDEAYLQALDQALDQVWARCPAPGLAFYLAGADPHEGDRLGRLKLSTAGMLERDRRVLQALRERRIPVALSMAGGYGEDLDAMLTVQVNTLSAAAHSWRLWQLGR